MATLLNGQRWEHVTGIAAVREQELQLQSAQAAAEEELREEATVQELFHEQDRAREYEEEGWEALRAWLASHPEYDDSD